MERNLIKNLSIFMTLALIMAQPFPMEMKMEYAITQHAGWLDYHRLTFMLFHANWIHLTINLYSLLTLVFLCNTTTRSFLVAISISALIPDVLLCDTPMLGISVLNYALTGLVIADNSKWKMLILLNMVFIAAGMFVAGVAVVAHLWGFVAGLIIGKLMYYLFTPIFDE